MYQRIRHCEQHLESCPDKLNKPRPQRHMTCLKKDQWNFSGKDKVIGQVTIGSKKNPDLVPRNSVITVPGQTNMIPSNITCLVEQAEHHNLPLCIIINRCVATTMPRGVPVILINTTKQNVWIWQPLLASELFSTNQIDQIEHSANMERKRDNINISFLPVAHNTSRVQLEQLEVTSSNITPPTSSDKPAFGPRPNTEATDFNFQAEGNHLPFKLNLRKEAEMTHVQHSQFININYDHSEVFSLHDEDLWFCDKIKHTIPTTWNKPVYLLHQTIHPQLQGEVCTCLDTWLWQGIIRPSEHPYISKVVIVCIKMGEVCLCMDYQKLNSIMVRDAFLLPRIDKTLQTFHSSN